MIDDFSSYNLAIIYPVSFNLDKGPWIQTYRSLFVMKFPAKLRTKNQTVYFFFKTDHL